MGILAIVLGILAIVCAFIATFLFGTTGAIIQLCDETTCAFQPTNADGIATFSTEEQKVYDMHVLKVPEGYAPDQGEYKTMETYSDVSVFLKKTE